jgi:hypothetical protein
MCRIVGDIQLLQGEGAVGAAQQCHQTNGEQKTIECMSVNNPG